MAKSRTLPQPPRVALIIETSGIYGRQILTGIARYLRSHHRWSVFVEQHELGVGPPEWLFTGKWDGILSRPTTPELAAHFHQMKVPVVDMNDLHDQLALPWVGSDHVGIGRLGATHLLERGYRHFAFAGFTAELWAAKRRDGFCKELAAHGFSAASYESPWRGPQMPQWDANSNEIVRWLSKLPQPLAVMACNDARGLHVLDACARLGALVPEQVAVVGVDNEDILCELCSPPLSSVEPDPERIGYTAAELLDAMMRGEKPAAKRVLIDPIRVMARRSTEALAIEDPVVVTAMRFIREQAVFGCTVADVLRHVRVSRSVLERRFRQHLKRSPQSEIRAVQMSRLKQLLVETDFTLERIAESCGFTHPEYMSVLFKRLSGLTPGEYRRKHGDPEAQ
ncbi:MAG TPA: XylR family transcriptional regulator [Dongiaceae bacterium]|nr:XylR family transcriptional regulator [Dongiaceae bacterium]